jgi:hypothetical protein
MPAAARRKPRYVGAGIGQVKAACRLDRVNEIFDQD